VLTKIKKRFAVDEAETETAASDSEKDKSE
jgi:hypothetical protein